MYFVLFIFLASEEQRPALHATEGKITEKCTLLMQSLTVSSLVLQSLMVQKATHFTFK